MAFYPNRGRSTLSDSDRRMLYDDSGIDPGVVEERGYYTARQRSEVPEVFKEGGLQGSPVTVPPAGESDS